VEHVEITVNIPNFLKAGAQREEERIGGEGGGGKRGGKRDILNL
jgi:hypothetical protein